EPAEHVRLTREIDRGLRDGSRVERERDRQGADVIRRGRRAVMAGRQIPVGAAVPRGASQTVVANRVALVVHARRARLEERPAGAARAIRIRDAAEVGVRAGHARAALAGTGPGAVGVGAAVRARRIRRTAAAGVVDAGATTRTRPREYRPAA